MSAAPRKLRPWEYHACTKCGAGAGERCRTLTTRYGPKSKLVLDGRKPGEPTTAHKARVDGYLAYQVLMGMDRTGGPIRFGGGEP